MSGWRFMLSEVFQLLSDWAWPSTVLILFCVFRKPIRQLLTNVTKMKVSKDGLEIEREVQAILLHQADEAAKTLEPQPPKQLPRPIVEPAEYVTKEWKRAEEAARNLLKLAQHESVSENATYKKLASRLDKVIEEEQFDQLGRLRLIYRSAKRQPDSVSADVAAKFGALSGQFVESLYTDFVRAFFPNALLGSTGYSGVNEVITDVSAVINVDEMPNTEEFVQAVKGKIVKDEPDLRLITGHTDGFGNCILAISVKDTKSSSA